MPIAFRPRARPSSMNPRCGAEALGVVAESAVACMAGFAATGVPESVVTSLAGFARVRFPQPPGGRIAMPAALRYAPAVSRRIRVICWIRRRDQPNWPSAMTWFFFSSLKTLLTFTEGILRRIQCPDLLFLLAGFHVTINGRFWVTAEGEASRSGSPAVGYAAESFTEAPMRLAIRRSTSRTISAT